MKYIPNYPGCYVCGDTNKNGLQYRFWVEDNNILIRANGKYVPLSREQSKKIHPDIFE